MLSDVKHNTHTQVDEIGERYREVAITARATSWLWNFTTPNLNPNPLSKHTVVTFSFNADVLNSSA